MDERITAVIFLPFTAPVVLVYNPFSYRKILYMIPSCLFCSFWSRVYQDWKGLRPFSGMFLVLTYSTDIWWRGGRCDVWGVGLGLILVTSGGWELHYVGMPSPSSENSYFCCWFGVVPSVAVFLGSLWHLFLGDINRNTVAAFSSRLLHEVVHSCH